MKKYVTSLQAERAGPADRSRARRQHRRQVRHEGRFRATACGSPRGGWPPAGRGRPARPPRRRSACPASTPAASQPRPLVLVREHVGVEIHAVTVCGGPPVRAGSGNQPGAVHRATYDDPVSSATVGVGDDDFVTGEAVALDLPPASIGSRMLSGFLDYLIVWVVTFTLVSAGAALSQQLDDALIAATVLVCFLGRLAGVPRHHRDPHPRSEPRQDGGRAAHRAGRRADRSRSGTRSPAACWESSRSTCCGASPP